jgi:hypothetical protein
MQILYLFQVVLMMAEVKKLQLRQQAGQRRQPQQREAAAADAGARAGAGTGDGGHKAEGQEGKKGR